jgi:uncharacterized membrane protein
MLVKMVKAPRLHYVDWARGLAALIMLQGHAFHSWVREDLRSSDLYQFSQLLGGIPAVLFLFLTGISLVILLKRAERRNQNPWRVILVRSGYILAAAFLFRIQQWLSWWPHASASGLLKVDILNSIAVGLAVSGAVTLLLPARFRMAGAAVGAVIVAMLTPLAWSFPADVFPHFLNPYLGGGAETSSFPLFPWVSYTFTGVLVGLAIVGRTDQHAVDRIMQWLVLLALVLIVAAGFFDSLPYSYYQPYNYWLTSPNLVADRTAVALLVLAASYGWTRLVDPSRYSWIRQLGTTSLLVYWVHIELTYGRTLSFLQGRLDLRQTTLAGVALIAGMFLLSAARTHGREWIALVADAWRKRYAEGSLSEAPAYVPVRCGPDSERPGA